jgi:hypothetical protein
MKTNVWSRLTFAGQVERDARPTLRHSCLSFLDAFAVDELELVGAGGRPRTRTRTNSLREYRRAGFAGSRRGKPQGESHASGRSVLRLRVTKPLSAGKRRFPSSKVRFQSASAPTIFSFATQ